MNLVNKTIENLFILQGQLVDVQYEVFESKLGPHLYTDINFYVKLHINDLHSDEGLMEETHIRYPINTAMSDNIIVNMLYEMMHKKVQIEGHIDITHGLENELELIAHSINVVNPED